MLTKSARQGVDSTGIRPAGVRQRTSPRELGSWSARPVAKGSSVGGWPRLVAAAWSAEPLIRFWIGKRNCTSAFEGPRKLPAPRLAGRTPPTPRQTAHPPAVTRRLQVQRSQRRCRCTPTIRQLPRVRPRSFRAVGVERFGGRFLQSSSTSKLTACCHIVVFSKSHVTCLGLRLGNSSEMTRSIWRASSPGTGTPRRHRSTGEVEAQCSSRAQAICRAIMRLNRPSSCVNSSKRPTWLTCPFSRT